jgi:hypothetical protein
MTSKKAKEAVINEVDDAPIETLINTAKIGLNKIWEPTETMIETLKPDAVADPPSVEEIADMEKKLNPIYTIVPLNITRCWANKYAKDNNRLASRVHDAYKERYVRLELQHEVAQGILRHKCPLLYATAAEGGHLKSIEWKSMRGRLSQNESTTHGKNWLDKMQDLLLNKLNKNKKKSNSYVISDNGDLQFRDGVQTSVTGHVNLVGDTGEDTEDNDKVDDDVDDETANDAGKQEVAVVNSRTAFPSSRTRHFCVPKRCLQRPNRRPLPVENGEPKSLAVILLIRNRRLRTTFSMAIVTATLTPKSSPYYGSSPVKSWMQ